MADKKKIKKKLPKNITADDSLSFHTQIESFRKEILNLTSNVKALEDRMQDAEIHINLLTRLLTTLCIEKFGMRAGVLKRIIQRIEKEAIRDSQIMHLESLFKMPGEKSSSTEKPSKNDPWEEIS